MPSSGESFPPVRPGDPILASDWNRVVSQLNLQNSIGHDAHVLATGVGTFIGTKSKIGREPGIILIRNDSGARINASHSILGINEAVITPSMSSSVVHRIAAIGFAGDTPDENLHLGKFAVLIGPVGEDGFQKAIVSGLTWVKISVEDEDHQFADIEDGETGHLRTVDAGSAQILWKEDEDNDDGERWAYVRLSNRTSTEESSGGASSGCGCKGIDPRFCEVAVPDTDCKASTKYRITTPCTGLPSGLLIWDTDDSKWLADEGSAACGTDDTRTVHFEMAAAGVGYGDVTISLTGTSGTIGEWENLSAWVPHAPATFRRKPGWDCSCRINSPEFLCLVPVPVPTCGNSCGCGKKIIGWEVLDLHTEDLIGGPWSVTGLPIVIPMAGYSNCNPPYSDIEPEPSSPNNLACCFHLANPDVQLIGPSGTYNASHAGGSNNCVGAEMRGVFRFLFTGAPVGWLGRLSKTDCPEDAFELDLISGLETAHMTVRPIFEP